MPNFHAQYVERWSVDAPTWEDLDDSDLIAEIDAMPERDDRAERLVRRFLRLCEHPRTSRRMLALVQSVLEGEESATRLIRLVNLVARTRLAVGGDREKVMRAQLVGVVLVGVAAARYLRNVEPLCSATEDAVVAVTAPAIRAAQGG